MKRKRLGEVLLERGKISPAKLQHLIEEQSGKVIRLGELILERGLVEKPALASALEEVFRIPYVDCSTVQCEDMALKAVPEALATRLVALPIRMEGSRLVVAMVEPQNLSSIDEIRFTTGNEISPRLSFRSEILEAIARNYGRIAPAPDLATPAEPEPESQGEIEFSSTSARQSNQEAIREIQEELQQKKTPAVRLVSEIIQQAILKQASDIHIEPQASQTVVRIRVDGMLRELKSAPRTLQNALISRIKILSDMDIAERRAPQDGRFMVTVGSHKVDMRVSTLPTQYGEKIVIRLLEASAPLLDLMKLGLPQDASERMASLLALPQGMVLVTGPTGSGKSTTLYSALNIVRKPSVNIITVEDPVEYELAGVNQVHVNTRAGLTFAKSLRSILRQDPNVIMVGEIRDGETAEIAMKAAQTGHLVLSTLHTNDSISAIVRLLDLGIPGYLIASSVTGILAQRLLRKLCSCHTTEPMTPEYAAALAELGAVHIPEKIFRQSGCALCDQSGYKGRIGVYELLVLTDSICSMIRAGARIDQIRDAARSNGMRRMQDDALDKLQMGITTIDEVRRVVPIETVAAGECSSCGSDLLHGFHFCPSCGAKQEIVAPGSPVESSQNVPSGMLLR
jgi:type IV pilus assembly protein PilB